jgi:transposase
LERVPLFADRGYDSRHNRLVCAEYGLPDRIFRRKTKTTRRTNARRIVVEHSFAWLDQYRRLLRLYDHTPTKYLNWVFLALGHQIGKKLSDFFLLNLKITNHVTGIGWARCRPVLV